MPDDHHKNTKNLAEAIMKLESVSEINQFLDDLCTRSELRAMAERWKVCQLLSDEELSYREIHKMTSASLTTIGRVARFLREEPHGGYRNILNKIKSE
jgi:TrpR-related protein YerC/YecD